MHKTKILITGANGLLGKEVLLALSMHKDYNIIPSSRKGDNNTTTLDISNLQTLQKTLDELKPDVIINLASMVDFSLSINKLQDTNINAPAYLAKWCKKHNKHLIQASSVSVLGLEHRQIDANTATNPKSDYSISKLKADNEIIESNCKYTILRFAGIYGCDSSGVLWVSKVIYAAKKNGSIPNVAANGKALRNYISAKDAAEAIIHCVKHKIYGVHLSANDEKTSILDMAQNICDILLDRQNPIFIEGNEASDQIIIKSPELPATNSFRENIMKYA